jgi:hypothetical protein
MGCCRSHVNSHQCSYEGVAAVVCGADRCERARVLYSCKRRFSIRGSASAYSSPSKHETKHWICSRLDSRCAVRQLTLLVYATWSNVAYQSQLRRCRLLLPARYRLILREGECKVERSRTLSPSPHTMALAAHLLCTKSHVTWCAFIIPCLPAVAYVCPERVSHYTHLHAHHTSLLHAFLTHTHIHSHSILRISLTWNRTTVTPASAISVSIPDKCCLFLYHLPLGTSGHNAHLPLGAPGHSAW